MTSFARTDRIDPHTSKRLDIARVLCILGMIWVHVPGAAPDAAARAFDALDLAGTFRAFVVESVGRSSAALLSVVSGWLCARLLLDGRDPGELVRARARGILVPMLFWSAVSVTLYAFLSLARPTFLSVPGPVDGSTVLHWIDSVVFLTSAPMGPTLHLSFMRDLFVCICLAPALLWVLARRPRTLLVCLGVVYVADLDGPLMLRPLVLFAFAIGLLLARERARIDALDRYLALWVALAGCGACLVMASNAGAFAPLDAALGRAGLDLRESVLYPLSRLFGSLAVWGVAGRLAGTRSGASIAAQMPWLFTTYCTHVLVLAAIWTGVLAPAGATPSTTGFTAWFLVAPLVSLLVGRAIVRITLAWGPSGAVLLGLRAPRPRHDPPPVGPGPPGSPGTAAATVVAGEADRRAATAPR